MKIATDLSYVLNLIKFSNSYRNSESFVNIGVAISKISRVKEKNKQDETIDKSVEHQM